MDAIASIPGTIDWCEDNYAVTSSVAEFWNTLSSGVICILGLVGLVYAWRFQYDSVAVRQCTLILIVGLGTGAFHGTLKYWGQMVDELSMLAATLNWIHGLYTIKLACDGKQPPKVATIGLAGWMLVFAITHVALGFVAVFQIHFALWVVIGMVLIHRIYHGLFIPGSAGRQLVHEYLLTLVIGVTMWQGEELACKQIRKLPFNPQLHAWWHVVTGYHCYIGAMALQYAEDAKRQRLKDGGSNVLRRKVTWYLPWIFPVCGRAEE
jgi:dihydroceramidase